MVADVLNAIENTCDEIGANYICTQCDSTFSKKQSLEKHLANEHADDDACVDQEKKKGKFDCSYCDSSFRRERNLKLHIRDDHEQDGDNDEEEEEEETNEEETVGFDTDVECDPNLMTYKSDQEELTEEELRIDNEETREEVGVEDTNNEETHVDNDIPINEEEENVEESSLVTYQEECLENNLDAFQVSVENDQEMLPECKNEEAPEETSEDLKSYESTLNKNRNNLDKDNFTETQNIDGEEAAVVDEDQQEMHSDILDADVLFADSSEDREEQSNNFDTIDDLQEEDSSLQAEEENPVTLNDSGQETNEIEHTDEFEQDGLVTDSLDQSDQVVDMETCEDTLVVVESEATEGTEQFEDSPMVGSDVIEEETVTDGHNSSLEFVEDEGHDLLESEAANPLEESVGLDGNIEGEETLAMADELQQSSIAGDELAEENSEEIADTNEEFLINGEPIVMDDIAFDILANTLEMTMETPEGEEVNLSEQNFNEKPKKESKYSKKRKSEESLDDMIAAPIDKKIKEEPLDEIELSGLPVFSTTPAPLSVLKAELKQKEVLKTRVYNKRTKSESSNNVAKKLICSYCKQIFPSRPDFNDHMTADHPDILAKHNNPAVNKTKVQVAPKKKGDIKSVSRSVKITHIPGSAAGKDLKTIKLEKVAVKEEEIIMKSIPKSTRIIFTPVDGDGRTPSKPVTSGRSTTMSTPNVGKGVKITQIGAKDVKVPGKGVKITQLNTKDVKVSNASKSVKMTPSSSKSVTITATSETSTTNPAKKLLCTYCKSVFLSRPDFNKHILDDHPEISTSTSKVATKMIKKAAFKCNPCQLSFEEKQKYEQHLDVKHGHKCDNCNVSFRVKSKLEEHKRTAHSFKCSICNLKFVASDKLTLHMQSHNIKCEQCPEVFKSKMKMLDHKKMKHSHKCDKCNVRFDEKSKLEAHMEKHRFKCDKCTAVFDTKLKVAEHKKTMHTFKCEKCKQSFEEKSTLEEHTKTNHILKCKVCSAVFDFKNKLEDHIQKEHSFKCTKCDETFELEESLVNHEKEKHSSCETCEDEFSWAEPGHSCYYTKNNIRPTKERVQVQNLYFDY